MAQTLAWGWAGLALILPVAGAKDGKFFGHFFDGEFSTEEGLEYLQLLDIARRMFAPADTEFMTLSGAYDPVAQGLTEGAQWSGAFWTQNSYGFAFSAQPFLQEPHRSWLGNSFLWWFDHMADGGQTAGGIPGVPDGMLCDNGMPNGCNYKQCGPSRSAKLASRSASKRSDAQERWKRELDVGDTAGVGHDWIIEGTLAGVIMQAEALLVSRNISGIKQLLPKFLRTSNFMESRRVPDSIPGGLRTKGLFYAGNGANLLAPSYGGFLLPAGCIVNATFTNCTNRAFGYLSALTVTYTAMLDRMIALEELAYPQGGHKCTEPNHKNPGPSECKELFESRKALNVETVPTLLHKHDKSRGGSLYFVRSIDPDGTKHGVLGQQKYSYFESAPNHDAIALHVADDSLASELYKSIRAVPELSPCDFTVPNWPDYDDSCGGCLGYGRWVSGGSWSTAEGRMILAHYRLGRTDLAAASMRRIVYPYAQLFKLDNPIGDFGCGPGMYSLPLPRRGNNDIVLDVDIFGIPGAFIRGLFEYRYSATVLTLQPHLPAGIANLSQKFPILWGNISLFLSMHTATALSAWVDGKACPDCVQKSSIRLSWGLISSVAKSEVVVNITVPPLRHPPPPSKHRGMRRQLPKQRPESPGTIPKACLPSDDDKAFAANATKFIARMQQSGLGQRMETAHAEAFLLSLNATVERCVGRLTGAIEGLPAQPSDWKKYGMKTNQTAADLYFATTTNKIRTGLTNLLDSYAQSKSSLKQFIYKIWLSDGMPSDTTALTRLHQEACALDDEIAAAELQLARLRGRQASMLELLRDDALNSTYRQEPLSFV